MPDTAESLKIYASPLPFSNKQIQTIAKLGSTVEEIVTAVCPPQLMGANIGAVVMINGQRINRKYWHVVRPKLGTVINVRIVPKGGKGKNPLAAILSIAVMIAAPYIAGAILGPTLAATQIGIGSLTYGGLLAGGISVVGKMLVSALAPPPKPSNAGSVSNPSSSPTQFIEGARNSINPFGVVPICLGTNRMVPLQAARPFTETENNRQFVRQLFTYGYGEKLAVSEMRIGETSIDQFDYFELEHRLNGDLHNPTNLYSNDVSQENFDVLLRASTGFETRTTADDTDEAIVDITFKRGLTEYNKKGKRISLSVSFEIQYAPAGTGDWSPGGAGYTPITGITFPALAVPMIKNGDIYVGYRRDVAVINTISGDISIIRGTDVKITDDVSAPPVPNGVFRLGTALIRTQKTTGAAVTTIISVTDDRQSGLFGGSFEDSASFVPSNSGGFAISDGGLKYSYYAVNGNTVEVVTTSVRIKFPTAGKYDIRIKRRNADTDDDKIFDKAHYTAIKSVKYTSPVELEGINGTAVRIRATDQLNGALDTFNALVSNIIPDYDAESGTWIPAITSNPASIYRYVLQGLANARPLADSKLDLAAIEDWHIHCEAQGYSYNRVIDYETSVDEILRDVAAAGAASPAIVDGKRTVVIDRIKPDIVQTITPRNSWGYNGEMLYSQMPHGFRVQFRNADKGYQQDEIIVYDDGYDETNATKFEGLELQSCTNSDLAFKTARRHIAAARLRPETHTFMMDIENLVALRGDRIVLAHDVPIVGIGDGRIKTVTRALVDSGLVDTGTGIMDGDDVVLTGDDVEAITSFTIDDTVTVPTNNNNYYVRIRMATGEQIYKPVRTVLGDTKTFEFFNPLPTETEIAKGDLCYFAEAGGELDLIITRIEPMADLTARITAQSYNEAIFAAESSTIPPYDSKVTTPLEFIRPLPPQLLEYQSDEAVMLRNADGTFLERAVFTLENPNEGAIFSRIKIRVTGTDAFTEANVLEASPDRIIITGLESDTRYDFHIRYGRPNSNVLSKPLELNGFLFVGSSGAPAQVQNFLVTVSGETALFSWSPNSDIDIKGYRIKYSAQFSGATWGTAQYIMPPDEVIFENRFSAAFQPGTYLIKAVDLFDNESADATAIITIADDGIANAVAVLTENPDFTGVKDNVSVNEEEEAITLADIAIPLGYYYFANDLDLTGRFTSFVSAKIIAAGLFMNNVFAIDDIFDTDNVFGGGNDDIFAEADVFDMTDVFGIGADAWNVTLQYRTTIDDPALNNWSDWQDLIAGNIDFWGIEFRIKLESFAIEQSVTPAVFSLEVTIDMPDRIERGEDIAVPDTGITIIFSPPFKEPPAIAITIQDGDAGDEIEYTSKTASGFGFRVYNTGTAGYVTRSADYIASGFGRENT